MFLVNSRVVCLLLIFIMLSGCNRLFFHPMKEEILTPAKFGMDYEDIYITTPDDVKIHGWHIPAKGEKKGNVIFFHGNAQNITTHIASVHWLPEQGYSVFLIDYRGYGRSKGEPTIDGLIVDAVTTIRFVIDKLGESNIIIFGQSLGGAIALNAISKLENRTHIKAIVVDSSFSGFRGIAREKLSGFWLTWLFQYPLSLAISNSHSSIIAATKTGSIPFLVIHGNADNVIPLHHGKEIFDAATPPKIFWEINSGKHIDSMMRENIRHHFIKFLDASISDSIGENYFQIVVKEGG